MNNVNYDKLMLDEIKTLDGKKKLLLHSCCAPCSSYCITQLTDAFSVTVFYYNPNIDAFDEYEKRKAEQIRFLSEYSQGEVKFVDGEYDSEKFYEAVKGKESLPEGGARCFECYRLRLEKTAEYAKNNDFDYFATTLTVSPLKNAKKLNEIGEEISKKYGIKYLVSDFKKREGYKKSIELSAKYGLYRQNYCGCKFSKSLKTIENEYNR